MKKLLLIFLFVHSVAAQSVVSTTVPVNTNMVLLGKGTNFFNVNSNLFATTARNYVDLPNMAALRTLPITYLANGASVNVLGYYSPGDGGGGMYVLTNTVSGTNAYGGRVLALGGAKSWEINDPAPNALQFGAKGDGVTDDTLALNALLSSDFSTVVLAPKGKTFLKTARLNFNASNKKIRWPGVVVNGPGVNYHSTLFGASPTITNGVLYPSIGNITIDGEGTGVLDGNSLNAPEYFNTNGGALYGGHGLYFANASNIVVTGLTVSNCPSFAVAFYGCKWIKLSNCNVDNGNGNNSTNFIGKNADAYHWTDCSEVLVENCTGRSCDDTYAITAIDANCQNFQFSNVRARHSILTTGNGYQPLGYCSRVSLESIANTTYARIDNVQFDNFVFTDGNGAMTLQGVSTGNQFFVSNVRYQNGVVANMDDTLVAGTYAAKLASIVNGVKNLTFDNVTWTNLNRFIFLQTIDGIYYKNNNFYNWTYNTNIGGTYGVITYTAQNGPITDIGFENCIFDGVSQQAIQLNGSYTGTNYLGNVNISGSVFRNGGTYLTAPALTGYSAARIYGTTNLITISDNRVTDWEGTPFEVLDGKTVRVLDNTLIPNHALSTNSQGITINSTSGTLIPVVDVSGNYIEGAASTGIFVQNFERLNFENNISVDNNVLDTTQSANLVQVVQVGSLPSASGVFGQVTGNLLRGTVSSGLRLAFSSTNAFTGTPLTVANNTILGFPTKISRDTSGFSQDRVYLMDPLVIGSTTGSSSSQSFLRYNATQTTDDDSVIFIERIYSGAGSSSTAQNSLNVIHRYQGSGGNTSILTGASVVMSHDQTANASLLRGVSSLTRLTSTGTATEAQAISAQIQHSGGGVITNANAIVVNPPSLTGGSTIGTARGVTIVAQSVAGVTNAIALDVQGSSDAVRIQGLTTIGSNGQQLTRIRRGTVTLTAGIATVSDANVTASSLIYLTTKTPTGTPGFLITSNVVASTSFQVVSSSASDTSTVSYLIVEP